MASKKVSWAVIDLRQGSKVFIFFCCYWWEYPGRIFHDAGFSTEEAICGKRSLQRQVQFFNFSVKHGKKFFRLHFWVIRIGSCSTFVLWRLKSIAFKLFVAIDLHSVDCGHVALYRSAGCAAQFGKLAEMWLLPQKVVQLKPDQLDW